jgi:hypothetical protein
MERARTVAGLASMAIFQSGLEMRCVLEVLLVELLMTRLTNIDSDILSRSGVVWSCLLLLFIGRSGPDDQQQGCSQ